VIPPEQLSASAEVEVALVVLEVRAVQGKGPAAVAGEAVPRAIMVRLRFLHYLRGRHREHRSNSRSIHCGRRWTHCSSNFSNCEIKFKVDFRGVADLEVPRVNSAWGRTVFRWTPWTAFRPDFPWCVAEAGIRAVPISASPRDTAITVQH